MSWKWLSRALAHPREWFSEGLFFLFVPLPSLSKKTCFLDQEEERSLIPLFLSLRLHGITEGKPSQGSVSVEGSGGGGACPTRCPQRYPLSSHLVTSELCDALGKPMSGLSLFL